MFVRRRAIACLALVALVAGCGGKKGRGATVTLPAALRNPGGAWGDFAGAEPFFVPGEAMTWMVEVYGIETGRTRLAVGVPTPHGGRTVLPAVLETQSSGLLATLKQVQDQWQAWVDLAVGTPLEIAAAFDTEGRQSQVQARLQPGAGEVQLELLKEDGTQETRPQRLPAGRIFDPVSTILLLRNWTPAEGSRARLHMLSGKNVWRIEVVYEGTETVDSLFGERRAHRTTGRARRLTEELAVDPKVQERVFTMFTSADDERIPLYIIARTDLGGVVMRLTSYDSPTRAP